MRTFLRTLASIVRVVATLVVGDNKFDTGWRSSERQSRSRSNGMYDSYLAKVWLDGHFPKVLVDAERLIIRTDTPVETGIYNTYQQLTLQQQHNRGSHAPMLGSIPCRPETKPGR